MLQIIFIIIIIVFWERSYYLGADSKLHLLDITSKFCTISFKIVDLKTIR